MHLHHIVGKTAKIISFLDVGPHHETQGETMRVQDMREFAEIMRRLMLPNYEEARQYWAEAESDGFFMEANESWIYAPNTLIRIIQNYGNQNETR